MAAMIILNLNKFWIIAFIKTGNDKWRQFSFSKPVTGVQIVGTAQRDRLEKAKL